MNVRVNNITMRVEMARNRMTNSKLKEITGISKATVSAVRNGKSCSYETARKLDEALKVDISEFIESEV